MNEFRRLTGKLSLALSHYLLLMYRCMCISRQRAQGLRN